MGGDSRLEVRDTGGGGLVQRRWRGEGRKQSLVQGGVFRNWMYAGGREDSGSLP